MIVFRLKTDGNVPLTNAVDWFSSNAYSSGIIQAIPDPAGGKGNEPTSIPSPFARMDVVRTAFKYVNEGAKPGTTFYKIVSDALDVGEIFFNYNRYRGQIKILEWDRSKDLGNLLNGKTEHKLLGETLDLFLVQDSDAFNFDHFTKIYLVEVAGEIIGGTSPVTLFFTVANDLSWLNITFPNGGQAFDAKYCPLHQRDPAFQKMLYAMRKSFPMFSRLFREIDTYLNISLQQLRISNISLWNDIQAMLNEDSNSYSTVNYDQINNGMMIIGNLPYYASKLQADGIRSDFEISSSKYTGTLKPLVLKRGHSGLKPDGTPMKYFTANYNDEIDVPHCVDEKHLERRFLPGLTDIKYPFVLISDLLEPFIIKTIFPINSIGFYTANFYSSDLDDNCGYLFPIKKQYFDFFDLEDLKGQSNDGRPVFELKVGGHGQVKVILRVAIKGGNYIEYERTYYPSTSDYRIHKPDEGSNRGSVLELDFSLSIYPMLKLKDISTNFYRVALIEADVLRHTKLVNYQLDFLNMSKRVTKVKAVKKWSEKNSDDINSYHHVIDNDTFDYIELDTGIGAKGLIIPNFKEIEEGNTSTIFSVDFGTTNTHIEYLVEGHFDEPKPLDITIVDKQVAYLHKIDEDMLDETKFSDDTMIRRVRALNRFIHRFMYETMPEQLGKSNDFGFPTRTAIVSKMHLNILGETYTLADVNIPFFYEKAANQPTDRIVSNLKWGNQVEGNKAYIRHFFEHVLLIIRNKSLLLGGSLSKVKLVCSFPTSMLSYRREELEGEWTKLYNKYFNQKLNPRFISESIAPFFYLRKLGGITSISRPVLSVDIGGETADFVVYTEDKPDFVTSVRFAANAIFGDGFNRNKESNGFVKGLLPEMINLVERNKLDKLKGIIEDTAKFSNSVDIINLLFAIESNKLLNPRSLVSFNEVLQENTDYKIVFVIYYASLLYHIAKLMKIKGLDAPAYVTFSGMGSKVINTIGQGSVDQLTKVIFAKIVGPGNIEVKPVPNEPKEITAKGSVFYGMLDSSTGYNGGTKVVLVGDIDNTLVDKLEDLTYNDLKDELYESVGNEYINFIKFFESLGNEINFRDRFGFTKDEFTKYKEKLTDKQSVIEAIKLGVRLKMEQIKDFKSQPIEETLFFYPLIRGLNQLAYHIYETKNRR